MTWNRVNPKKHNLNTNQCFYNFWVWSSFYEIKHVDVKVSVLQVHSVLPDIHQIPQNIPEMGVWITYKLSTKNSSAGRGGGIKWWYDNSFRLCVRYKHGHMGCWVCWGLSESNPKSNSKPKREEGGGGCGSVRVQSWVTGSRGEGEGRFRGSYM